NLSWIRTFDVAVQHDAETVFDPGHRVLVVVISAALTHNESASLLYLGKSHQPAPMACTDAAPIIHSHE
ncbi:MAG TPA: hypothetical protein VLL04_00860, partial [Rhizomicrobium sp.]|nr:hypothetical protein [Rhizomicrobium sp.]